ncbi:MAG TPA: ABC transporter ATP-binding protein [Candidatus Hydromicrobium sp.]
MVQKILRITGLKKRYNSKFCLTVDNIYTEKGKILTIIGPNGSGKSTLIRLINLLEKPDSGKIYFNNCEISGRGVKSTEVRKKMAVVFQEPLLFNTSVYNNIIMGLKIRKIKISEVKDRVDYFINKLKIESLLNRSTRNLSGGEKQRVSLARAMVLDPELLLLDEPLANIDQSSRESLRLDLFEVLKSYGKSVVYVTHDRNEAMVLADDIAVMDKGKILQFAGKEEVFRKPKNEFIARFVGVETIVNGIILESRRNVCRVGTGEENNNNEIFVVGSEKKNTAVTLAIRPEDVILYNTDISSSESSAMNLFKGNIIEIKDIGIFKRVEIDCGFALSSFVTQDSISRLNLSVGRKIFAAVKASSIHMFKR